MRNLSELFTRKKAEKSLSSYIEPGSPHYDVRLYALRGDSIRRLGEKGKFVMINGILLRKFPGIETIRSRAGRVAIVPEFIFLPDSNNKTLQEQQEMIKDLNSKGGFFIEGLGEAKAVIPNPAELSVVFYEYLEETDKNKGKGKYLFSQKLPPLNSLDLYSHPILRTETQTKEGLTATVSLGGTKPYISEAPSNERYSHVFIPIMFVPAERVAKAA